VQRQHVCPPQLWTCHEQESASVVAPPCTGRTCPDSVETLCPKTHGQHLCLDYYPRITSNDVCMPCGDMYAGIHLGCIAPSFMISVQLNLDQKLNQVHADLRCTKLNSNQLIPFSWTAVVIPWTTLIGQPCLAYEPTTMMSQSHAMLTKQFSTDWP